MHHDMFLSFFFSSGNDEFLRDKPIFKKLQKSIVRVYLVLLQIFFEFFQISNIVDSQHVESGWRNISIL